MVTTNGPHTAEKNSKPAPPIPTGEKGQPIPVKVLRFQKGTDIPVPGTSGGVTNLIMIVTGETQSGDKASWEVVFLPWLRHHRVTWTPKTGEPIVFHVPEGWCTWQ